MFHPSFSRLRFCCFAVCAVGLASAAPIPVQSFQQEADGLSFAMQPGTMKLRVCEDGIIRVTYAPGATLPATQDIAVIKTWPSNPAFTVTSDAATITLATSKLRVRVDRTSGRLQFTDPGGNVVLEEPADGGKTMPAATVNGENSHAPEQTFLSPTDEALYGMGQYQEGLWNYRGIPLVLRQVNTHTSVPMLVSSRGYGLFWNNAALTHFNPADTEVAINSTTGSGTFTTTEAGEYAFQVRDGDLRDDIGVSVNGSEVARITNMWVPHSVSGKITLPANTVCTVQRHGGGSNARVFARPLGDRTVFRSEVGDAIDYYYFHGPTLDEVIAGYRQATGGQPMLPKWATGFWQCRERYSSQQQILDTVAAIPQPRHPARSDRPGLAILGQLRLGRLPMGSGELSEPRRDDFQPARQQREIHDFRVVESTGRHRQPTRRDDSQRAASRLELHGCLQFRRAHGALECDECRLFQHRHRRLVAGCHRA